jgi:hypothetical protein
VPGLDRLAHVEAYIERAYDETARLVDEHPFTEGDEPPAEA